MKLTLIAHFLAAFTSLAHGQAFIRVGSLNIAEFGEGNHAATRRLDEIASLLVTNSLDLIAIQEVGVGSQATDQVNALVQEMNTQVGTTAPQYFSVVTPQSGDERCAAIYRFPVVFGDEILWLDEDADPANPRLGGRTYYRIPVALPFRADDFDFMLVIVHLTWGDLKRREREVANLGTFLRDDSDLEKDWIVIGDMNRYGKYSQSDKKAFDKLLKGNWETLYRFPLLEAITDPDDMRVWRASQDEHSTTVAETRNIYDQIIITAGAFNEFETANPIFGTHVGIIAFDQNPPYTSLDHNAIKYRISDHRPIWIQLRTDLGDDD